MRHAVAIRASMWRAVVGGVLACAPWSAGAQEPAAPAPAASAAPPAGVAPAPIAAPAPIPAPAPVAIPAPPPTSNPSPQRGAPAGDPALSAAVHPEAASTSAFFAGVRLGFEARPGDVIVEGSESGPGSSSSTTVSYRGHQKLPLTLDVGGRLSPNVTLSGYGRFAAVLGGQIDTSWSIGAVIGVLPAPSASMNPWIAVAVGYQSLGASGTLTGLEISPQVGLLFKIGHLTLGPIAELILVDYSAKESICSSCSGWNAWGSLALRVGWM
jgi:hypothetical protein